MIHMCISLDIDNYITVQYRYSKTSTFITINQDDKTSVFQKERIKANNESRANLGSAKKRRDFRFEIY